MHRLQELVRLHRLGTPCREVARPLRMGPAAERGYREALAAAGLASPGTAPTPRIGYRTLPPSTPKNVANPATSPTMDSADRLTSAKPPGISRGLRRPSAVRWNALLEPLADEHLRAVRAMIAADLEVVATTGTAAAGRKRRG